MDDLTPMEENLAELGSSEDSREQRKDPKIKLFRGRLTMKKKKYMKPMLEGRKIYQGKKDLISGRIRTENMVGNRMKPGARGLRC